MESLVSVIIPVYNAEKTLVKCLESVLKQDYKNLEIILVNDGSTDSSLDICNEFCAKDDRVKVYTKENGGGPSPARNYGLNKATGEFVCFVDSDDTICRNYISEMVVNMGNNDLLIANINIVVKDEDVLINGEKDYASTQFDGKEFFKENIKYIINEDKPIRNVYSKLFRTDKINELNLRFNEKVFIGEDYLFVLEYMKHCTSIKMIDTKLYNYFHMKNSITKKYQENLFTQIQLLMESIKNIYETEFEQVKNIWNNFYIWNLFSVLLNIMRYAPKAIKKQAVKNVLQNPTTDELSKNTQALNLRIKVEKFILKRKSYFLLKILHFIYGLKKVKYYEVKQN